MSPWLEQELGPCVHCPALFPCRELGIIPARGHCFDCQREFVFLPNPAEDDMYPRIEGHARCRTAAPVKRVVWCPPCKQELGGLLLDQQVPISRETFKLG